MDALGRAAIRVEVLSARRWTQSDEVMRRRYGFRLTRRDGIACFTAERGLFGKERTFGHRAIGFGTTVPATQDVLDRVRRVYDASGGPCRIHVVEGLTSPEALRLLRRNGFQREDFVTDWHALVISRVPHLPEVDGVIVHRVTPEEAALFSTTARDAFGESGPVREYFHRTLIAILQRHPRTMAGFLATSRGRPAGTGGLIIAGDAGGLYSGAVLRRYRGRGIQSALIAARLAYGVRHGVRSFFSQTYHNPVSAGNLTDLGFRPRWRIVHWSAE